MTKLLSLLTVIAIMSTYSLPANAPALRRKAVSEHYTLTEVKEAGGRIIEVYRRTNHDKEIQKLSN